MFYNFLFQKIIFPILEKLNGTSIRNKLKFLQKSQWWSKDEIEKYQNKKLQELIKHAYNNVPYYHKLFKKLNLKPTDIKSKKDLYKLPILTKEIIKKNFKDLCANNYIKKSFLNHSSGSTGDPMKFYQDKNVQSWCWAATFRAWGWSGFQLGNRYIKLSLNKRKSIKKRIQDILFRTKYSYAFDLDEKRIQEFIHAVDKFKPKIIRGYSSSMYVVAKYLSINNIKFKHKVKAIYTTGDNLFPEYRKLIEKEFGCKVIDGYGGGGEMLTVAFQCEKCQGYHLMQELVITELINSKVKGNKDIILTGLHNYAMPLIRYKIGDLAIDSNRKCICGRNLKTIKKINGRDTDIIKTKKGNNLIVHFFTTLFEYIEGVDTFQIIQEDINGITINIVKNGKYTKKDEKKIIDYIKKGTYGKFKIKINYCKKIPVQKSGKRRFIISKIK